MRMIALVSLSMLAVIPAAKAQSFQERLQYLMDECNDGNHRACQMSTQMMRNETARMQGNMRMMDQMMLMEDQMHGPGSGWANSFGR